MKTKKVTITFATGQITVVPLYGTPRMMMNQLMRVIDLFSAKDIADMTMKLETIES